MMHHQLLGGLKMIEWRLLSLAMGLAVIFVASCTPEARLEQRELVEATVEEELRFPPKCFGAGREHIKRAVQAGGGLLTLPTEAQFAKGELAYYASPYDPKEDTNFLEVAYRLSHYYKRNGASLSWTYKGIEHYTVEGEKFSCRSITFENRNAKKPQEPDPMSLLPYPPRTWRGTGRPVPTR